MIEMNKDIITAFVDGEITDEKVRSELLSLFSFDKEFAIDYKMQSLVKSLIKEKLVYHKTPDRTRAKILRSIGSKTTVKSGTSIFETIFYKPAFSFATAFVVILAVILIIVNRPGVIEKKDYSIEQLGDKNMFVQAKNNFNSIITGKLAPQLTSENAVDIKNFFINNGVKYTTSVPAIKDWALLGAVVSEDKGEKFAHHVYTSKNGQLAYLFQVDESYLYSSDIISLSSDLIKYLDDGNCYSTVSEGSVTLFTKVENNIFAVVSNSSQKEIEKLFCSL